MTTAKASGKSGTTRRSNVKDVYKIQSQRKGPVATLPLVSLNAFVVDAFEAMKAHRHSAFVVNRKGTRMVVTATALSKQMKKLDTREPHAKEQRLSDLVADVAEPIGHSSLPQILAMAAGQKPVPRQSKPRFRLLGESVAATSVIAEHPEAAFWKEPQPTICYCKNCHRAVQKGAKCCNNPDLICVP